MSEFAVSQATAQTWIERWDSQQQAYLPDREDRFTALIDAVEETAGRPDPLVLDLGSGPGSLSVRLLRRLPAARVVAVDADPMLLALGRSAWREVRGLRFADADLRTPGWLAGLGLDRQPDAAVSTTALHWLPQPALAALYAELAAALRPGGVVLNGDHMRDADDTPTLARLGRALIEREERRRFPGGHPESWTGWWEAAAKEPALASLYAQRQARQVESEHHGSPSGRLHVHVDALGRAGFTEIGPLWQRGENRLLCGVLPGVHRAGAEVAN
ncbi:MAG TPA: class I SAM-dependent methyltransferase [Streptosporangiaceae bacterium]|jgi:SAM-dependent methyltransferase